MSSGTFPDGAYFWKNVLSEISLLRLFLKEIKDVFSVLKKLSRSQEQRDKVVH